MPAAPLPANESTRLATLLGLEALDTPPDPRIDRLTQLAARLFDVPIVLVSLVDEKRQWFKSRRGIGITETPRDAAFCAHAILGSDVLVVEDAHADPRFADNPLVLGRPHIRFYAGAPLVAEDGSRLGTFCIIDSKPRQLDAAGRATLADLAGAAMDLLTTHRVLEQVYRAREEAMLAARAKGEFLAFMSHELRTPLNAVIGFSELLERETFGPLGDPHYKDYAALITNAGRHLLEVINSILDLSRIEAGKMTLLLDRLKVSDEADVVISLLLHQARQKEQSLVMDASLHGLPVLQADRSAFRQVLLNLIANAIKFTPAEGRIVVRGAAGADGVRISVTDTGPGIPPADLVRLGEAFYQAGPRSQRRKGTGLGLAISFRLMALHGGRLEITSEPGQGTVATMVFPVTGAMPSTAHPDS